MDVERNQHETSESNAVQIMNRQKAAHLLGSQSNDSCPLQGLISATRLPSRIKTIFFSEKHDLTLYTSTIDFLTRIQRYDVVTGRRISHNIIQRELRLIDEENRPQKNRPRPKKIYLFKITVMLIIKMNHWRKKEWLQTSKPHS